jgi:signal transduction histidine kinase
MNFHELLATVLTELEAGHPDRIECSFEAADARGEWDPDRLAQVAENLVVNALKYGTPGGTVHVKTWSDESSLMFAVHNDGAPIAPDKIGVIFEPLQRAGHPRQANPDRSIGMGLFIVKHIVEAHGGETRVDSTAEDGTTFTVRLPRR